MTMQTENSHLPNATEAQYQAVVVKNLIASNINTRQFVPVNGSRGEIDVLTPDKIIECKRLLTRQSLLMALGQLHLYAAAYPERKLAIAGPLPDAEYFPDTRNVAEAMVEHMRSIGVEVMILEKLLPQ